MHKNSSIPSLSELLHRGGLYYEVQGNSVKEVLADMVESLLLPEDCDPAELLSAMVEREGLMTTAVGDGIAFPHPRNPLLSRAEEQFIAISFLARPIDWNALDGKKVHTLVSIISANPQDHLRTLSRVSYLCRQEGFRKLLVQRASGEELFAELDRVESSWAY